LIKIESIPSSLREDIKLRERLERVRERIEQAAEACGRPATDIRLVAVSKTMGVETVREAIETGMTDFGERLPGTLSVICNRTRPNMLSGYLILFTRWIP
jgi:hypothetical protein